MTNFISRASFRCRPCLAFCAENPTEAVVELLLFRRRELHAATIRFHFFFGERAYTTLPVLGEFPQRTLPLPIATAR